MHSLSPIFVFDSRLYFAFYIEFQFSNILEMLLRVSTPNGSGDNLKDLVEHVFSRILRLSLHLRLLD